MKGGVHTVRSPLPIDANHPAFAGHFPGSPVLPGVVLLDEALFAIERDRAIDLRRWQVSSVKFLKFVLPGEALTLEHEAASGTSIRFTIMALDRPVLAGTLSAAAAPGADRFDGA